MDKKSNRADQYDDPGFNYLHYWDGRKYEHQAELMAIRRLLKGKHFKRAVDVGGGYGRLSISLKAFADEVVLAEPSQQQLDIAKRYLGKDSGVERQLMQADDLKFESNTIDLVTMIRVMHHLENPIPELSEIERVLRPGGLAIIEVANYMHALNRLKYLVKGKKLPTNPVDIRSPEHKGENDITFVNHNPYTVIKQLKKTGFTIERILSVSNLRMPTLKKIVPINAMIAIEGVLQPTLAKSFFGPSVFFLVKKPD
ncbi:MAG TPA: class I SAM-dependent methyltransferase [Candidatus Saccharimonadales bacterium]|nr:class I SAM-dependent methyltransferase [Candidatus Saccharimonadales bacterium]